MVDVQFITLQDALQQWNQLNPQRMLKPASSLDDYNTLREYGLGNSILLAFDAKKGWKVREIGEWAGCLQCLVCKIVYLIRWLHLGYGDTRLDRTEMLVDPNTQTTMKPYQYAIWQHLGKEKAIAAAVVAEPGSASQATKPNSPSENVIQNNPELEAEDEDEEDEHTALTGLLDPPPQQPPVPSHKAASSPSNPSIPKHGPVASPVASSKTQPPSATPTGAVLESFATIPANSESIPSPQNATSSQSTSDLGETTTQTDDDVPVHSTAPDNQITEDTPSAEDNSVAPEPAVQHYWWNILPKVGQVVRSSMTALGKMKDGAFAKAAEHIDVDFP